VQLSQSKHGLESVTETYSTYGYTKY